MKSHLIVALSVLYSFSGLAATSLAEKRERVEELMKLKSHMSMLNFDAYERELQYEETGLTHSEKVDREVKLLADKMKHQVIEAFDIAFEETRDYKSARKQVEQMIKEDLKLAHQDYQKDLKDLAKRTLDVLEDGGAVSVNEEENLPAIRANISMQLFERSLYLNQDDDKNSKTITYNKKKDLVAQLVADKANDKLSSGPTNSMTTTIEASAASKISLQVKMEFLGASLEAGPTISFKRSIETNAVIIASGLHPIINKDGSFDFYKRDQNNNVIKNGNKAERRSAIFTCNAQMNFETEYKGGGGFSYMGVGANVEFTTKFKHNVRLNSREVALPDVIENKTTNVKMISNLCHNDFVNTKVNNKMTVFSSLDLMMKNVASGLVFSHSKTTCVKSTDCDKWFKSQPMMKRQNNVPRCVQHNTEKYQFCQLRGSLGQKCSLYSKGKLITSGVNEYSCDVGLKCKQTEAAEYILGLEWNAAVGRCQK